MKIEDDTICSPNRSLPCEILSSPTHTPEQQAASIDKSKEVLNKYNINERSCNGVQILYLDNNVPYVVQLLSSGDGAVIIGPGGQGKMYVTVQQLQVLVQMSKNMGFTNANVNLDVLAENLPPETHYNFVSKLMGVYSNGANQNSGENTSPSNLQQDLQLAPCEHAEMERVIQRTILKATQLDQVYELRDEPCNSYNNYVGLPISVNNNTGRSNWVKQAFAKRSHSSLTDPSNVSEVSPRMCFAKSSSVSSADAVDFHHPTQSIGSEMISGMFKKLSGRNSTVPNTTLTKDSPISKQHSVGSVTQLTACSSTQNISALADSSDAQAVYSEANNASDNVINSNDLDCQRKKCKPIKRRLSFESSIYPTEAMVLSSSTEHESDVDAFFTDSGKNTNTDDLVNSNNIHIKESGSKYSLPDLKTHDFSTFIEDNSFIFNADRAESLRFSSQMDPAYDPQICPEIMRELIQYCFWSPTLNSTADNPLLEDLVGGQQLGRRLNDSKVMTNEYQQKPVKGNFVACCYLDPNDPKLGTVDQSGQKDQYAHVLVSKNHVNTRTGETISKLHRLHDSYIDSKRRIERLSRKYEKSQLFARDFICERFLCYDTPMIEALVNWCINLQRFENERKRQAVWEGHCGGVLNLGEDGLPVTHIETEAMLYRKEEQLVGDVQA